MAISRCWSGGHSRGRAALAERDIWLRIAPHLVRPMRFAIPAHSDERPPGCCGSWLLLYDRLASRARCRLGDRSTSPTIPSATR
jgi:glycerol-3-phosphate dehydrogenase